MTRRPQLGLRPCGCMGSCGAFVMQTALDEETARGSPLPSPQLPLPFSSITRDACGAVLLQLILTLGG